MLRLENFRELTVEETNFVFGGEGDDCSCSDDDELLRKCKKKKKIG